MSAGSNGWNAVVPFDPTHLNARLVRAAASLGVEEIHDPELDHLVGVVTRCSALLRDVYTDETLQAILSDDPRRLARVVAAPWFRLPVGGDLPGALRRLRRLPESVRGVADQALFDLSISGRHSVRGVPLDDLGPRAYRLASEVLELMADDARLREHFVRGHVHGDRGLGEEVAFLRRCAERFDIYARLLRQAGGGPADDFWPNEGLLGLPADAPSSGMPALEGAPTLDGAEEPTGALAPIGADAPDASPAPAPPPAALASSPADTAPVSLLPQLRPSPGLPAAPARRRSHVPPRPRLFDDQGRSREELLAAYERLLLFSSLDLRQLGAALAAEVIDQDEAIATLIDDFSLFAVGTQSLTRPASYFLVGPTGVGKNHLVETLRRTLAAQWQIEVPMLTIEGPNYTYPSDINELRGATRGFIRSDEPGLLTDFHAKAANAPLSILLVDEVEKAHPQLIRFFLSILDRGTTTDAHGNELSFAGALVFFTSNIGHEEQREGLQTIGFGGEGEQEAAYRAGLSRSLRRALPPEFINRVKLVRFRHLPRASAERILRLEFARIAERYRTLHGIELELSDAGREALLDRGYSHDYGARHLAAVLNRTCNVEIGKMLRRDEPGVTSGRRAATDELLARLRLARAGVEKLDLADLDDEVLERARARVEYRRIVVDAADGEIVYRRADA